MVEIKAQQAVI